MDTNEAAITFMAELPQKVIAQKIQLHKCLAYSFVYMAKANKLGNHIGLYKQYMKYAADHLAHAKRLKAIYLQLTD